MVDEGAVWFGQVSPSPPRRLVVIVPGFAEWCAAQPNKELWNPAGVAFYEHLFDTSELSSTDVLPWLSQRVRGNCRGLWEWRLPPEKFAELDRQLRSVAVRRHGGP